MKVSDEFVVGKNNIGWVDSSFTKEYKDEEILPGAVLPFQKLTKNMYDADIITELKVQECTLGDVLEVMKNAPEELKDGYSNLFYIKGHPSRVVRVYWRGGEWHVFDWRRGAYWDAGSRVFSPATGALVPNPLLSETLEFCSCERCKKCGKLIK